MPTDTLSAQSAPTGPHVETVRFRLLPGQSPDVFLQNSARAAGVLATLPGFRQRLLSADAAGWQDVVIWDSLAQALEAMPLVMAHPEVAGMMAAIDPESIEMRHAPLLQGAPVA